MEIFRKVSFLIPLFLASCIDGFSYEYTFIVPPGETDCYYQDIKVPVDDGTAGRFLEVDYQVLNGGDNDITFYVKGPSQDYLKIDRRQKFHAHEIKLPKGTNGLYEFCFDNNHSRLTSKTIYFELYCELPDHGFEDISTQQEQLQDQAEEYFEISTEQIQKSLSGVRENLDKSRQLQHQIRAFNRIDRSVSEDAFTRVNRFSALQLFVMVSVSIVQVMMIRNLFNSPTSTNMKVST